MWYRFNRLAWGYVDPSRPQGVIAAGLENGELALWDPAKILSGAGYVFLLDVMDSTWIVLLTLLLFFLSLQRRVSYSEKHHTYRPGSWFGF